MELWLVIKGQYEDAHTVGIATSEASAARLAEQAKNPSDHWTEEVTVYGPFPADELSCGCPGSKGLCYLHN
jgi:hypothetical protein